MSALARLQEVLQQLGALAGSGDAVASHALCYPAAFLPYAPIPSETEWPAVW